VTDACRRAHDQAWLGYQEEGGLRHTPTKKNATDGTPIPERMPLRYLVGFIPPVALSGLASWPHSGCLPPISM
jgi:hypothetical protein